MVSAPYDLTWKSVDLNGLPLNPRWALQDSPTCPNLPSTGFCPKPWGQPCTTQETFEVPLPPLFDPAQPLNLAFCKGSPAFGKGINGHHENWKTVTYEGAAHWESHSPPGEDDDYNIVIARDDHSGYTQDNSTGMLTEFDSDETIDYFVTPWWTAFHKAVDHSDADAEYKLTLLGQPAYMIQVGMMGLDCAHFCGSEIHPTFGLAVHIKYEPGDDQWAIFGRIGGTKDFALRARLWTKTSRRSI
jgi:hypothetical protein